MIKLGRESRPEIEKLINSNHVMLKRTCKNALVKAKDRPIGRL